jgi:hypothetical protein
MYVNMHVYSELLYAYPLLADLKTGTAACGGQNLKNAYIKKNSVDKNYVLKSHKLI